MPRFANWRDSSCSALVIVSALNTRLHESRISIEAVLSRTMTPLPTSSIPCLRCASFDLQCCVIDSSSPSPRPKFICNQCDVAVLDQCIFPPSIRLELNNRSNTKCVSCSEIKSKCVFLNETDEQCARCSKLLIPCVFKLNGKCQRYFIHKGNK